MEMGLYNARRALKYETNEIWLLRYTYTLESPPELCNIIQEAPFWLLQTNTGHIIIKKTLWFQRLKYQTGTEKLHTYTEL